MEFKIGDRVSKRSKTTGEVYSEELIKNANRLNDINDYIIRGQIGHYTFEFWQPKEGEWCWFWDDASLLHNGTPHFGRYGISSYSLDFYQHCEPFIGELPSFLKELK